ncbi:MAG: gliding motility-associated C-terminal domain-containing protein [Saprospiraceae bacterium]
MLQQLLTALVLFCGTSATSLTTPPQLLDNEHMVVVMNNELIFEAIAEEEKSEVLILNQPEFGTITLNADYSFTFSPIENICEETDTFSYLVNHPAGIDTVEVKIDILCEPLTILNGFTPDGDGVNDHFTILGVQNFPNNSLAVFNSKGEEVYYMKGYNNEWDGELEDGTMLPADVYYYVFHDGTNYHSGYMKIDHKVG